MKLEALWKTFVQQHISMFAGQERVITIRFKKHLIGVVIDKFGTDVDIRSDGEDYLRARVHVAVSPQLYGWLTGIGATVCFPQSEADAYKTYLEGIIEAI